MHEIRLWYAQRTQNAPGEQQQHMVYDDSYRQYYVVFTKSARNAPNATMLSRRGSYRQGAHIFSQQPDLKKNRTYVKRSPYQNIKYLHKKQCSTNRFAALNWFLSRWSGSTERVPGGFFWFWKFANCIGGGIVLWSYKGHSIQKSLGGHEKLY